VPARFLDQLQIIFDKPHVEAPRKLPELANIVLSSAYDKGMKIRETHAGGLWGLAASIWRCGEHAKVPREYNIQLISPSADLSILGIDQRIRSDAWYTEANDKGLALKVTGFVVPNAVASS
jgi:hypothetical protein